MVLFGVGFILGFKPEFRNTALELGDKFGRFLGIIVHALTQPKVVATSFTQAVARRTCSPALPSRITVVQQPGGKTQVDIGLYRRSEEAGRIFV